MCSYFFSVQQILFSTTHNRITIQDLFTRHAIFTLNHEFSEFEVQRNWGCVKLKEIIMSIVTNILYLLHIQHLLPNRVFFRPILYLYLFYGT